jgi:hypothetical protein
VESTTLNLLTREGAVTVLIVPALKNEHYAELYEIVCSADTPEDLRAGVEKACEKWNKTVSFG